MHFYSGLLMYFCSGVDIHVNDVVRQGPMKLREKRSTVGGIRIVNITRQAQHGRTFQAWLNGAVK